VITVEQVAAAVGPFVVVLVGLIVYRRTMARAARLLVAMAVLAAIVSGAVSWSNFDLPHSPVLPRWSTITN